ncbi:hypothetical protein CTI12_AA191160 [Artemisia annua]|uniref:Uncharacterized protein n=1 Tax=Artemisia annua TaxID=35608 RepID=A0A2U1P5L2_ARTAN|nr:hypothetical protein CTI12_AA191160 [Artemisia annua]
MKSVQQFNVSENLLKENASLLETVNKLKRDVAKLETFRTTLMMSLQDEEESLARGPPEYEESTSSIQSHSSNVRISYHDEHVTESTSQEASTDDRGKHFFQRSNDNCIQDDAPDPICDSYIRYPAKDTGAKIGAGSTVVIDIPPR